MTISTEYGTASRSSSATRLEAPLISEVTLRAVPRRTLYGRLVKRPLDICVALAAIILLSPIMVTVALAIPFLLGPGGVVYKQERVGRGGKPFTILKFRSMMVDRRERDIGYGGIDRRQTHKSGNDPRHRPFGQFIRAFSLDELPQFINILRGDMSLVGPRPEITDVARKFGYLNHPRNLTRPGLTGEFQVSELRATNQLSAGLHLDIDYVVDVSVARDLKILLRTLTIPFARRGS